MAVPATRADFKEYCLRKLGKPVLEINISDDQAEDRIDQALKLYWDYHYDGVDKVYYPHPITATDITNKYITLPSNIIGAVSVFDFGTYYGINNMFNIRYQMALNDLYTFTTPSLVPYYMAMQHLQFIESILVGKVPIRYNRKNNKLYLDMDFSKLSEGDYVLVEAYSLVDPATVTKVWGDYWLSEYATALMMEQWGNNLSKFSDLQLPGGVRYNGDKILERAEAKLASLKEELIINWSEPPSYMIG
jgi:hypothetical protein